MKAYDELTRLGRLRRLRQVAGIALAAYGLGGAAFRLVRHAGNSLYRVVAPPGPRSDTGPEPGDDDRYLEGQYLLRVHEPGYQSRDAIEVELAWLRAMSEEADLPVPQPVLASDGHLLTQVSGPGVPGVRACSLLRWLQGRFSPTRIGLPHYRAQGRLMARLHQFSAGWDHPLAAAKRRWDWSGLFGDVEGTGMAAEEIWPLIPAEYVAAFKAVMARTAQVMDAWGRGPDVYGLIHADLGVDANLLFWRGEARAIDFDDSGFGYWIYDLAVSLEHVRDDDRYPEMRDALLGGYAEVRRLPEAQVAELELFLAAFYVYLSFWCAAMTLSYPHYREELMERLRRAATLAAGYVARL